MNIDPSKFSAAGQPGEVLRDEDWNFRPLFLLSVNERRPNLAAVCWYEYARESRHVRRTMRRWLALQEIRDRLRPYLRQIFEDYAHEKRVIRGHPVLIVVDGGNWESLAEQEMLRLAFSRDKRLPRPLCKALVKLHNAENEVQKIESNGGVGAPRLRMLAKYLVEDEPWLRIPVDDQNRAIATAVVDRSEVPRSAAGEEYFRAKPAFERMFWGDFLPPQFSVADLRADEDLDHREITSTNSSKSFLCRGDETLPIVVRWLHTDAEIVEDFTRWVKDERPDEWKDKAKNSGRGRLDEWTAALKELAAMRLMHSRRLQNVKEDVLGARESFRDAFAPGDKFDDSALARLRRNALKTFTHLFPFGEYPIRAETFADRQRAGNENS